jgi:hypothetical protein
VAYRESETSILERTWDRDGQSAWAFSSRVTTTSSGPRTGTADQSATAMWAVLNTVMTTGVLGALPQVFPILMVG